MPTGTPFDVNPLPQARNLQHRKSVSQRVTYNVSVGCLCVSEKEKGPLLVLWYKWQQPDANIIFLHSLLLLMKISERTIIYNIYMGNIYKDTPRGQW